MKKEKNIFEKIVLAIIICVAVAVVFFPFLIAHGVYNTHIFPAIPGGSDVWMGFWASYSGTVVTLIVAACTWYNSKSIGDLQMKYYQLNAGVNLRLVKVTIVPIIESGNLNRYKIIFCFRNMAKSLIEKISLCNDSSRLDKAKAINTTDASALIIKVGEQESSFGITDQYFGLQDDNAILQFEINLKESKIKKNFIKSYFYFSQFPVERNDIILDADIRVDICKQDDKKSKQDDKKSKPDDRIRHLHIELFPEPVFDKTNTFFDISDSDIYMDPFRIKVKQYTWSDKSP